MTARARLSALAAALVLFAAAPGFATTGPGVGVRLHSYTPPAAPGAPATFQVRLEAREALTVSGFRASGGEGRRAEVASGVPQAPVVIPRGENRVYTFTAGGEAAEGEVVLRFTANGKPVVKRFDFSAENRRKHLAPAALRPVTDAAPLPPADPTALRAAPATLRERPEGRRPVRTTQLQRTASPAAPTGTQGRNIRVRGALTFERNDGVRIGADAVTFRVYDEDWDWDELLYEGTLETNGSFDVTLYFSEDEPDIYVEFETSNAHTTVEDGTFWETNYQFTTGKFGDYTGSDANFGVLEPSDGSLRPVLLIFTNIHRAWRWWAQNRGNNVDPLECQYPDGDWPHYDGEIHIPWSVGDWATRWASDTHVHEYGHHLRNQFMSVASSDYDNGICNQPDGDPGHCAWCEETGATAINEGWPNWYADFILSQYPSKYGHAANANRDTEGLRECRDRNGNACACDRNRTEGFFQVLFNDIVDDTPGENDPLAAKRYYFDKVNSTANAAIDVVSITTTTAQFIQFFRDLHPEIPASDWWHTMNNAGFYSPDTGPPELPPVFWSPSHDTNVLSPKRRIEVNWQPGSDAESGVAGYFIRLSEAQEQPTKQDEWVRADATSWASSTVDVQPGHSYYVSIRTVDQEGNLANFYRWVGPFPIRLPEPPDMAATTPGSTWYRPLVARDAGDATVGGQVWPTASLPGNTAGTWLNVYARNGGELPAGDIEARFLLDGRPLDSLLAGSFSVGQGRGFVNAGPFTVRGGRHAIQVDWDSDARYSEWDEENNLYTTQYTWLPLTMSNITTHTRLAPPMRDAGRRDMDPSQDFYWNCDGLRFKHRTTPISPISSYWSAVALHQVNWQDDYDLSLFTASDLSGVGFDVPVGRSNRDEGLLDAVFSNRREHSVDEWDVGVVNADSGLGSYRARHVTSGTVSLGDSVLVSLGANVMLSLRELPVAAGQGGTFEVLTRLVRGSRHYYGLRFAGDFEKGGIDDYEQKLAADDVGTIRMVFDAPAGEVVPLAFYRNPSTSHPDSTLQFTLQVRRVLPDLVTSTTGFWHAPIVPRPATGTYALGVPAPSSLAGDGAPTYLNWTYENDSPSEISTPVFGRVRHDLTTLASPQHLFGIPAGQRFLLHNQGPYTLPAGRHVLSLWLDWYGDLAEEDEGNNLWAEQWVWTTGDSLAYDEAAWRAGTNGRGTTYMASLSAGDVPYPNADGVRTPRPPGSPRWFGAALMPRAADNDVDLHLHELATGPKAGFADPLAASEWGPGALDYVLWDHGATPRRAFDLGLVRQTSDTASYVVQPVKAAVWTVLGGSHSGQIEPGRVLDVHEFDLPAGIHRFDLTPIGTPVDWGMALHAPVAPYSNRSAGDSLGSAWAAPEGAAESFTVTVATSGRHALAVWKNAQADLADNGRYSIAVTSGTVGANLGVPAATRLAWVSPNPSRGTTLVRFELASESEVALEVHDVRGARVRTLASGRRGAGAYDVAWDGRDDEGRPLPAGVYLARLRAGAEASVAKIVRVK